MSSLAAQRVGVDVPAGTEVTSLGLVLPEGVSQAEWQRIGSTFKNVAEATAWWIADWAFYGEWEYGKTYKELVDETGYEYQTLADFKYVASRVELSRRREKLSFTHHREVAPLSVKEQDAWLDLAEKNELSTRGLREAIRASKKKDEDNDPVDIETWKFIVAINSLDTWKRAAKTYGQQLEEWATEILDTAASEVLI